MKVLMSCGGTGGHIYPGIAIAQTIAEAYPDAELVFVGATDGQEKIIVPKEGYELHLLHVEGLRKPKLSPVNLRIGILALTALHKAKELIRELKPDLVIGTGGYACWPSVKAASELGIPTALHESNAAPGKAVKKLQGSVNCIFTNFEQTAAYLPRARRIVRVGNPTRSGFRLLDYENVRRTLGIGSEKKLILSVGGSGGAEHFNAAMLELMSEYDRNEENLIHVHAAGNRPGLYETMTEQAAKAGLEGLERIRIEKFIYNMPEYMAAADLIICRAGAMTISELALLGKACILVPSPYVANNHQYANAEVLFRAGAAGMIFEPKEENLKGSAFVPQVCEILGDKNRADRMGQLIKQFALPDANHRIEAEIAQLLGSRDEASA
ncbi:MAG: UDP-N-acetylglucosamine--N-acetylmuramyl-(pentapeptide) pyrophosphoryl-undecaprenol N-acetylglucosamine transferase [Clostridia bacterium]|nr:UDP-N-acetylglucosamine--N-acetylmuramyl-(pentapeptide) pyrophosphoryl-undecaprenol N-acetylglucosamine transferase [Clostridia bacterium]